MRDQIEIGIITALPKEYAAMKSMLENPKDLPVVGSRATQRYLYGTISARGKGYHPIVLALLPTMGNNSAAGRATLLLEHFPNIRSILMVGIAGGAPNPAIPSEHVRLGDIIVSGQQGIVQYDYVKEAISEIFVRNPPRPPSAELLEAVRYLEADELAGVRPWLTNIELASGLYGVSRPSNDTDILAATPPESGFITHPFDPSRLPGNPKVFCGPIGSANNLLKNAKKRDSIRDKFGARAFEMEGSGIADASWAQSVGYLVIRGISDYCDELKNDGWQGYAAVVAAAYARALISSIPTSRNEIQPDSFKKNSESTSGSHGRGQSFSEQIAEMYRLLHYDVDARRMFAGRPVDLFLTGRHGDMLFFRAVECCPTQVTPEHINTFAAKLRLAQREFPTITGTIISGVSFPAETIIQAKAEGILTITIMDLSAQLLDGNPYARTLIQDIELDSKYPLEIYIQPLIGMKTESEGQPATEILDEWLADPRWNQMTLLGDVGTGKTFLSKALAHRLAISYLKNPLEAPLPVMIDLRNADRWLSLEGLLHTHLHRYGLPHATFDMFQHALSNGRVVLILDGFDEMAARVTPQITNRNFQELVKCVRGKAKVLLTCRTHYFKNRTDEEQVILNGPTEHESEVTRQLYWDLVIRKGFKIAYLRQFETWQVEEYVSRVKGANAKAAMARMRSIYNLMELSKRPMLLDMIVKSIDRLNEHTNVADLYQVFTDVWINRDRWRDVLNPEQKLTMLKDLAWQLWASGKTNIHFSDLLLHLEQKARGLIADPGHLVDIDNEVRTASFLVRDSEGRYSFAHKSYAEFFLAKHLHVELLAGHDACLDQGRVSTEEICFLRDLIKANQLSIIINRLVVILRAEYRPHISENALLCWHGLTRNSPEPPSLPLLNMPNAKLENCNLEGLSIPDAILTGARLSGAVLTKAELRGAVLDGADLRDASLKGANLLGAHLRSADLTGVNFEQASLNNADLTGAIIQYAVFIGANYSNAIFSNAQSQGAEFGDSRPVDLPSEQDISSIIHSLYPVVDRVLRRSSKYIANKDKLDDVKGEILLKIHQLLIKGKLRESNIEPYLYSIVRSTVNEMFRKNPEEIWDLSDFNEIPDGRPNPEEQAASQEILDRVSDQLESIDAPAKQLLLDRISGYNNAEIALRNNISVEDVRLRVSRLLLALNRISHQR